MKRLKNLCRNLGGEFQDDEFMCQADSDGFTEYINFAECCPFKCRTQNKKWKCRLHGDKCEWQGGKCQPFDDSGYY